MPQLPQPYAPSVHASGRGERQRSGLRAVASLLPYLWPKGDPGARVRLLVAVICLVLAKVATVYVPVLYSRAVDALAPHQPAETVVVAVPAALIIAYGLVRLASSSFAELRDAVFAAVQQRTARKLRC